jgi:hypothetical protein
MENLYALVLWVQTCDVPEIDVCAFDGEFGEHLLSDCDGLLAAVGVSLSLSLSFFFSLHERVVLGHFSSHL